MTETYLIADLMDSSGVKFGTSGARGLVTQMSNEVCYAYTAAFLANVVPDASQLVIGHDLRPSSPALAAACAQAARDANLDIVFVGALPTPAIAFYAAKIKAPALIITGSHIPFDRNGIKFYRAEGEISKTDEQALINAQVTIPVGFTPSKLPPVCNEAGEVYVKRYVDFFGEGSLNGLRIAVYQHSSVAREVLTTIFEALGAKVLALGRTDTFVPIDTEAVRAEDIEQAQQWATEHEFDAICSTDGDADRPLIGDEQGNWLRGDIVGILCAQFLGADTVVTPVSSNTAVEKSGYFGSVIRTRIGSPYVIAGMEAASSHPANSVVGYEANGGFLLGSIIVRNGRSLTALPTRDAVLPMLALLFLSRERNVKLSALSNALPMRFTHSNRLQNFAAEHSAALLTKLAEDSHYAKNLLAPASGEIIHIDNTDGFRVTFANDDIVHLRASGNAPELRCYAESSTQLQAQLLCENSLASIAAGNT